MRISKALAAAAATLALAGGDAFAQCRDCGIVVDTRTIKQEGEASGVGAVAGGVIGGVLGHQVGSGSGNTAATIGGAVIGGVIGHQVEQRVRGGQAAGVEYVFRVRMDDGSYQTFRKETHDNIRVGDRVRVERGNMFLL